MEVYPVKLSHQATVDLTEIYRYISNDLGSPLAADRNLSILEKEIKSLGVFPERCPVIEGFVSEGIEIRKLVVKRYLVFYRFIDNIVTVLRVLHASSNIDRLLEEIAKM